jgi:hypothetical protein
MVSEGRVQAPCITHITLLSTYKGLSLYKLDVRPGDVRFGATGELVLDEVGQRTALKQQTVW